MKRFLVVAISVGVLGLLVGAAFAHGPGTGWGMGWGHMGSGIGRMGAGVRQMGPGQMGPGHMGSGHMGPGMMGGPAGQSGCPGSAASGTTRAQVTEEKARELAQQYADQHLTGFTVDTVLPFTGRHGTMYSVELTGPQDEVRTFHINPWGQVMPFGGPGRRAG